MSLPSVKNIWSDEVRSLPNKQKAQIYYERAKIVVQNLVRERKSGNTNDAGRPLNRAELLHAIGCARSTLTQNAQIRSLLASADAEISASYGRLTGAPSPPHESGYWRGRVEQLRHEPPLPQDKSGGEAASSDKHAFHVNALGAIILTNESFTVAGRSYPGIPVLVWPDGYDEEVSDFLRQRVLSGEILPRSAHEYCKVLRVFRRRCRRAGRVWDSIDDNFLEIWREEMRGGGVSPQRINYCLNVVFQFYLWAEREKRLRYHVGAYLRSELPAELENVQFPLTARGKRLASADGQFHFRWVTPLLLRVARNSVGIRHTPTEHEIKQYHDQAILGSQGTRNGLIASWIEETGARPSEALRIRVSQLPTYEQVFMLIEDDRLWEIKVRRKGDSQFSNPSKRTWGNLMASPDLILNTLMYIADERAEIVRKHRDNNIGYVEPDEIFLSETYTTRTRGVLQTDSLTAIGVSTFKKAGIENAGPHRFRARFAVRVVEELVDALLEGRINLGIGSDAIETLMTMASERMSHMSPRSIRPYINFVLARRLRNTDAHRSATMRERIRQLGLRESIMVKRLDDQARLHEIASFIRVGETAAAICLLKSLTSSLEVELAGAGGICAS